MLQSASKKQPLSLSGRISFDVTCLLLPDKLLWGVRWNSFSNNIDSKLGCYTYTRRIVTFLNSFWKPQLRENIFYRDSSSRPIARALMLNRHLDRPKSTHSLPCFSIGLLFYFWIKVLFFTFKSLNQPGIFHTSDFQWSSF